MNNLTANQVLELSYFSDIPENDREIRDAQGPVGIEGHPGIDGHSFTFGTGSSTAGNFVGYNQVVDPTQNEDQILELLRNQSITFTNGDVNRPHRITPRPNHIIWEEAGEFNTSSLWLENPPEPEQKPFLKMIIIKL